MSCSLRHHSVVTVGGFFDAGIFNFDAAAQATGLRERLHGSVAMPPKAWQLGWGWTGVTCLVVAAPCGTMLDV